MKNTCVQQKSNSFPYKKSIRFYMPTVIVNETNYHGLHNIEPKYHTWVDGTNMDKKHSILDGDFVLRLLSIKKQIHGDGHGLKFLVN